MRRLVETLVAVGIIAGMLSASVFRQQRFYGSWGVEPTAEVLAAWAGYKSIVESPSPWRTKSDRRIVRASSPITVFDSREKKNVHAVKVEYIEEFDQEAHLEPRRSIIIIGYAGDRIVRWHYDGKGPKEYREAF